MTTRGIEGIRIAFEKNIVEDISDLSNIAIYTIFILKFIDTKFVSIKLELKN